MWDCCEKDADKTNNVDCNFTRLEGGSAPKQEVDDELKDLLVLTDEEDQKPPPKLAKPPAAGTRPSAPAPVAEAPKKSKHASVFRWLNYIKTALLVIILLIVIVLLAHLPEDSYEEFQTSINPDEPKEIPIKDMPANEKRIDVTLKGPFVLNDECPTKNNAEEPLVSVFIAEKNGGAASPISKDWDLCVADIDYTRPAALLSKQKIIDFERKKSDSSIFLNFSPKNLKESLFVRIIYDVRPTNAKYGVIYGVIILIFLYFMIVTEIINRTFASLIAAAMALAALAAVNERANQNRIIAWIDVETLALLVGMMLLVSILAESGIFDYFAVFAYKVAKGRVWPLINCLCFFTAFLAMFLDSVTMMLLATPVTIRLCEVLSLDPVPVLISMVLFANVGAAMTPVGDPPNVIISLNPVVVKSGVNFGSFTLHMMPGVILALIQTFVHIRLLYRKPESLRFKESKEIKDLKQQIAVWQRTAVGISPTSQEEDAALEAIRDKITRMEDKLAQLEKEAPKKELPSFEETLAHLTAQYPLRDKSLLIKASIAFLFVLFLFFTHSVPGFVHISLGWAALLGALLLIVISDRKDLESILVRLEWSTLLFFAALFIVMESLSVLGVIELIGEMVVHMISSVEQKYQLALAIFIVIWVSGIASAFLDNIPVTTMMVKIIIKLAEDETLNLPLHPLVWSLAFGACLGGNGTIIGASANVVAAGVSEQHGYKISFVRFFIVCFPIMLGSLVVATIYLMIAHVAFKWHDPNPENW